MKTIFENSGGAYTQVGDYLLPNLSLSAEEKETNIGVYCEPSSVNKEPLSCEGGFDFTKLQFYQQEPAVRLQYGEGIFVLFQCFRVP